MIATFKAVRGFAGGCLLFLGLFPVLQDADAASVAGETKGTSQAVPCDIPHGQNAMQAEQDAKQGSRVIVGEVLRVDGVQYVVREESGKEVSLQADESTEKTPINKGDRISANVDNQNRALWIRANRGTDRRTEHASADCNPNEEPSDQLPKHPKSK